MFFMFMFMFIFMFMFRREWILDMYIGMSCVMLVILRGVIEEHQSFYAYAALHMNQDTQHQYRDIAHIPERSNKDKIPPTYLYWCSTYLLILVLNLSFTVCFEHIIKFVKWYDPLHVLLLFQC